MELVLVSACLLGERVRYNGQDAETRHSIIDRWMSEGRVVSVCPELLAGFAVPRAAVEIVGSGGAAVIDGAARAVETAGRDVTSEFVVAAERTLKIVQDRNIRVAVLTDGSPSCGTSYIYDGTFTGEKHYAMGVTASLLSRHGIVVFNQDQLLEADGLLAELEMDRDP
jgi:uncharacterized protein YbbK (DUF523 family)